MSEKTTLYRGAGGKKPRTPVTTNDNIFSRDRVELLLGVGEGPIFGLQNGEQSFFVGDVPLRDSANQPIFTDFVATPYNGVDTDITVTFQLGGESHSTDVGVAVTNKSPVVRYTPANMRGRFNRIDVRINIAELYLENAAGDVLNNIARFRVEYKATNAPAWIIVDTTRAYPPTVGFPLGKPLVTNLLGGLTSLNVASQFDGDNGYELTGKTSSGFVLDFSFPVTVSDTEDYALRVTKFNPDTDPSNPLRTPSEIVFDSFQLINQSTRTFKDTALVHIVGKASDQFSSIPDFHGIYKGLITKIPVNYDPNALGISLAYDEPWNGSLTPNWHSNPAWVLYDLLTNQRYGLAKYASEMSVNLQDFYEAGKWCDELVQSFTGSGVEKRYTMNLTIAENQTAWDYLQNIAGSFDGVIFDDGEGNVRLKVDKWVEPRVLFTPETINAEGFSYSFTDLTTRYNQITVSFNDSARGWEQSRRKVPSDTALLSDPYYLENGLVPLDMVAVGCITESEALRRATARIATSNRETTIVSFTTTRLGLVLDPLEIIYLADPVMGWGITGRVESISGDTIRLRDEIVVPSYPAIANMFIQTETGVGDYTVVLTSSKLIIVVDNSFLTTVCPEHAQFSLSFSPFGQQLLTLTAISQGPPKPFRITSIEPLDGYDLFRLTALEVNKAKYDVVGSDLDRVISINTDTLDLDLRKLFLDQGNPQKLYNSVTFTINGLVEQAQGTYLMISASAVQNYALKIGDWTGLLGVGVKPKIIIKGAVNIYGKGGKGGDGGNSLHGNLTSNTSGFNGGNSTFLDFPVEIEVEAGGVLNIFGGFGGGYGGDPCLVAVESYLLGLSQFGYTYIAGAGGSGGSGGFPYGAAGVAGTNIFNVAVAAGQQGTKSQAGGLPPVASTPVMQTGVTLTHGQGAAGSPSMAINTPVPYLNANGSIWYPALQFTTLAGSRSNGLQGIGVINRGNLTITVAPTGEAHLYSDLYGFENF